MLSSHKETLKRAIRHFFLVQQCIILLADVFLLLSGSSIFCLLRSFTSMC